MNYRKHILDDIYEVPNNMIGPAREDYYYIKNKEAALTELNSEDSSINLLEYWD